MANTRPISVKEQPYCRIFCRNHDQDNVSAQNPGTRVQPGLFAPIFAHGAPVSPRAFPSTNPPHLSRDYKILDGEVAHVEACASLPLHHRDPFDRLLAAQAQLGGLVLISRGRNIARYGVPTVVA